MKNKQILQKATDRAFENGWGEPYKMDWGSEEAKNLWLESILEHYYEVIFSHDFAKAFWGEELNGWPPMNWESHLQQMVLEEEPLKYIERFLTKK